MVTQAQRVLIVEDEFIVARNIQSSLEGMGYEPVGIAGSCEEACRLAEALQPDLVLMDIRLRGAGDGIEAAEAIHAKHQLPVVYLTAHSDAETLERARTPAAYGFLVKPFDDRSLHSALEFAFMRHQLGRELMASESRSQKLAAELSAVLDTTAVGLALLDAELRVTRINARLKELFAIEGEWLGERWLDLVPLMRDLEAQLREALRGRGLSIEEFYEEGPKRRVFKLSTRKLSAEFRGSPEILLEVIDLTEHVAAEVEKRRLEEALSRAQKLESMGLMAGGVAHDFNNLLSVIMAYSDLAIRGRCPSFRAGLVTQ
jgi:two-component system cell cycle sensor histidine kinase/response regulator CckA